MFFLDQKYPEYNELKLKSQNPECTAGYLTIIQEEDSSGELLPCLRVKEYPDRRIISRAERQKPPKNIRIPTEPM
jgi:hypothetical protein